jgi:hypothetical protein
MDHDIIVKSQNQRKEIYKLNLDQEIIEKIANGEYDD